MSEDWSSDSPKTSAKGKWRNLPLPDEIRNDNVNNSANMAEIRVEEMKATTARIFGEGPFQVRCIQGIGRHIVTNMALEAGHTVLISHPYLTTVDQSAIQSVCAYCLSYCGLDDQYYCHCSTCNRVWYCSDSCRIRHENQIHRFECNFFVSISNVLLRSGDCGKVKLQTLVRLLILKSLEEDSGGRGEHMALLKGENNSTENSSSRPGRVQFGDVENLTHFPPSPDQELDLLELISVLRRIMHPRYLSNMSDQRLIGLSLKSECNQFGLWNSENVLLGLAIHPSASFFNHSCIPNCYSYWCGTQLIFETLYPISEGTELTMSYIDSHGSREERREELGQSYHFLCCCKRCKTTNKRYPRKLVNQFYEEYLKCQKGPGIMVLPHIVDNGREDDKSVSRQEVGKDNVDGDGHRHAEILMSDSNLLPLGYETRFCMTCNTRRRHLVVPSLEEYIDKLKTENADKWVDDDDDDEGINLNNSCCMASVNDGEVDHRGL